MPSPGCQVSTQDANQENLFQYQLDVASAAIDMIRLNIL